MMRSGMLARWPALMTRSGMLARWGAAPAGRDGLWLGVVLALLAALPAIVATYPQMADYPAHLARYHVMIDGEHNPWLARHYRFEWILAGNLGVDLLIRPLAAIMGLELAGRLVVGLIPVLTGFGILAVEWTLRRRIGIGGVLAFAFIWSPMLLMGFLNFGLALALALFAFAGWVRLENWRWRWLAFLPVGCLVWLCHVSGWGTLGIMVFGYEWHRRKDWRAFVAPWPLTLPFLTLLRAGAKDGLSWGKGDLLTYKRVIWEQAMRDQWQALDHASLVVILLILAGALLWRRIDGRLGWAALIMLVLSLVMPRHIFGGDYADFRMISSGLLVSCLAISWSPPRWVLIVAASLFVVRVGVTTIEWQRGSQETAAILSALGHLPRGARVAAAQVDELLEWGNDPASHLCAYAVVRRDALTNCNFAIPGVHMLTLRNGGQGFVDPSQRIFHLPGQHVDLAVFAPAARADYLWYIGAPPPVRLPVGAQVLSFGRGSLLLRLANPARRD